MAYRGYMQAVTAPASGDPIKSIPIVIVDRYAKTPITTELIAVMKRSQDQDLQIHLKYFCIYLHSHDW